MATLPDDVFNRIVLFMRHPTAEMITKVWRLRLLCDACGYSLWKRPYDKAMSADGDQIVCETCLGNDVRYYDDYRRGKICFKTGVFDKVLEDILPDGWAGVWAERGEYY
jgi:hypothetical protein